MNFFALDFNSLDLSQLYEIIKSRNEVFLLEQNIVCQDLDDTDYQSTHIFFQEGRRVIAYLRAYSTECADTLQIGRVLTLEHGKGIGRKLMEKALEYIKENTHCKKITLHSQTHAEGFYKKFGFKSVSDVFMEEGVPHVTMEREI
jgi:ElaA protein